MLDRSAYTLIRTRVRPIVVLRLFVVFVASFNFFQGSHDLCVHTLTNFLSCTADGSLKIAPCFEYISYGTFERRRTVTSSQRGLHLRLCAEQRSPCVKQLYLSVGKSLHMLRFERPQADDSRLDTCCTSQSKPGSLRNQSRGSD